MGQGVKRAHPRLYDVLKQFIGCIVYREYFGWLLGEGSECRYFWGFVGPNINPFSYLGGF